MRIRKVRILLSAVLMFISFGFFCNAQTESIKNGKQMEKILFINGSPNRDGNTAALAKTFLEGKEYETLMITDYRLNYFGQTLEGDQLDEILGKMKSADVLVMGSPVYWHNICASMRSLMERFYGYVDETVFSGKRLFFLYQGGGPTQKMLDDGEYTMRRFATIYGFTYEGMATNKEQALELRSKL